MKRIVISMAAAAVLLFAACQATPETAAIEAKNKDLESRLLETAETGVSGGGVETSWQYEEEYGNGVKLSANAVVSGIKSGKTVPVAKLENNAFTSEECRIFTEKLLPGYKVYRAQLIKQQIEKKLMFYKELLSKAENGQSLEPYQSEGSGLLNFPTYGDGRGGSTVNNAVDQLRALVSEAERDYLLADDISSLEETDYVLRQDSAEASDQLNITAVKDDNYVQLDFVNWKGPYHGTDLYIQFDDMGEYIERTAECLRPDSLANDAEFTAVRKTVDDFVETIGADYMKLQAVDKGDGMFAFYYTRDINGYSETYTKYDQEIAGAEADANASMYNALWGKESLIVQTIRGDITSASWYNISNAEVENDNANVMSFEEAKSVFEKQMKYTLGALDAEEEREIVITRVELGLTKVLMQNGEDYKLIPTWCFCGHESYASGNAVESDAVTCFVCVNAVDGTVIDRENMH